MMDFRMDECSLAFPNSTAHLNSLYYKQTQQVHATVLDFHTFIKRHNFRWFAIWFTFHLSTCAIILHYFINLATAQFDYIMLGKLYFLCFG